MRREKSKGMRTNPGLPKTKSLSVRYAEILKLREALFAKRVLLGCFIQN